MSMPTDERIVNQCSLDLDFDTDVSETFSLRQSLEKIKKVAEKDEISKLFNNESVKIKLSDIDIYEDYACLLLSKIDKDVSDVVYSDITTFERREICKKENEGNTMCCHVVISLNPISNYTYNCVIEQVLGIGLISDISHFLQYLFKKYCTEFIEEKAISPKCSLKGRECQSINDALQKNVLSRIKLLTKKKYHQGIDRPDYVSVDEKKIAIHGKISGESALKLFKDIITSCVSEGGTYYTSLSLTISDGKKQKTNQIPLIEETKGEYTTRKIDDILSDAFFQPERITGLKDLEIAPKNIRSDLVSKMSIFLKG